MSDGPLRRLPARPVRELVRELLARKVECLVTLHLTSGRDIQGQLVAVHARDERSLTMAPVQSADLTYLSLDSVEAVTVHSASALSHILSQGALDKPGEEVPSTLRLKRRCEQISAQLSALVSTKIVVECAWDTVPATDAARVSLGLCLEQFANALEAVASDAMGRNALNTIHRVVFGHAVQPHVERNGDILVVSADLEAGPAGRPARPQEKIESLF
ncbi:MAG: hypothetical protein AAGJ56_03550 [Myxococcota bacterium]